MIELKAFTQKQRIYINFALPKHYIAFVRPNGEFFKVVIHPKIGADSTLSPEDLSAAKKTLSEHIEKELGSLAYQTILKKVLENQGFLKINSYF